MNTDVLIVGSGIAGLSYALKVAEKSPDIKITIITKLDESEANTKYAQGGIAAVTNLKTDSFEQHINDTLKAGDGLCYKKVVERVIKEAPERLKELANWGMRFDKKNKTQYDLGKEGGHSANRIIHHKDLTGLELQSVLLKRIHQSKNIEICTHFLAIDLITEHHLGKELIFGDKDISCYGLFALDIHLEKVVKILAKTTLLATGGAGQVYEYTTNPAIATADGIAMAYRAKATINNMEFIQFHPTALYNPIENPAFLISEAVRGKGAVLRTKDGELFMQKYNENKSLATRDIVARSIDRELKTRGDEFVYLDCSSISGSDFQKYFPNIYKKCQSIGINVPEKWIPVVPATHYLCGGIQTDLDGKTNINNLYACGECACTGLHGANRLASNSLLEALVFAHNCAEDTSKNIEQINMPNYIPDWDDRGVVKTKEQILIQHNIQEIKRIMTNYVGIVRSDFRLKRALTHIKMIYEETEDLYNNNSLSVSLCQLRNLATTAYIIVQQSLLRTENKGAFFNINLDKS